MEPGKGGLALGAASIGALFMVGPPGCAVTFEDWPLANEDAGASGAPSAGGGTGMAPCGVLTDCDGACVDLSTSREHCGACGTACDALEQCVGGHCECQEGMTRCSGTCVDLTSDADHCGGCGQACADGLVCSLSSCTTQCGPGLVPCGQSCVDTNTSNEHCGGCDNACTGDPWCVSGTCICPSGTTLCGEACVDVRTSTEHCQCRLPS